MPFAVLTLAATLLMSRLIRRAQAQAEPRGTAGRALLLGIVIGLAALTRNEAIWLGLGVGDPGAPPAARAAASASG